MRAVVFPAGEQDLDGMVVLLRHLFTQEAEFDANADLQRRALVKILASPEIGRLLVAREQDRCVGMVNLLYTVSTAEGGIAAWLEDLVVMPERRAQGIGSLLLDAAVEDCRARGIRRITLLTDGSNERAQRFYERHGFGPSGMIPFRRFC